MSNAFDDVLAEIDHAPHGHAALYFGRDRVVLMWRLDNGRVVVSWAEAPDSAQTPRADRPTTIDVQFMGRLEYLDDLTGDLTVWTGRRSRGARGHTKSSVTIALEDVKKKVATIA